MGNKRNKRSIDLPKTENENSKRENDSLRKLPEIFQEINEVIGNLPEQSFEYSVGKQISSKSLPTNPLINVKIIGVIGLPIQKCAFDELKTKFSTQDSKHVEIPSPSFDFENQQFMPNLISLVNEEVKPALNVKCDISLKLKSFNIYEAGWNGKTQLVHLNTNRGVGINNSFGLLDVQLPSIYKGGKILLKYDSKVKEYNNENDKTGLYCSYTAYYSDIEHQRKKVTTGYLSTISFYMLHRAEISQPIPCITATTIAKLSKLIDEYFYGNSANDMLCWALSRELKNSEMKTDTYFSPDKRIIQLFLSALIEKSDLYSIYLAKAVKSEGKNKCSIDTCADKRCTHEIAKRPRYEDSFAEFFGTKTMKKYSYLTKIQPLTKLSQRVKMNINFDPIGKVANCFTHYSEDDGKENANDGSVFWWASGRPLFYIRFVFVVWKNEKMFDRLCENDFSHGITHINGLIKAKKKHDALNMLDYILSKHYETSGRQKLKYIVYPLIEICLKLKSVDNSKCMDIAERFVKMLMTKIDNEIIGVPGDKEALIVTDFINNVSKLHEMKSIIIKLIQHMPFYQIKYMTLSLENISSLNTYEIINAFFQRLNGLGSISTYYIEQSILPTVNAITQYLIKHNILDLELFNKIFPLLICNSCNLQYIQIYVSHVIKLCPSDDTILLHLIKFLSEYDYKIYDSWSYCLSRIGKQLIDHDHMDASSLLIEKFIFYQDFLKQLLNTTEISSKFSTIILQVIKSLPEHNLEGTRHAPTPDSLSLIAKNLIHHNLDEASVLLIRKYTYYQEFLKCFLGDLNTINEVLETNIIKMVVKEACLARMSFLEEKQTNGDPSDDEEYDGLLHLVKFKLL